ncbi:MAG: TIGR03619 family F420-dependent LLM class oxidoreductase [Microthrixaceae bacterium]
MRRDLDRGTGVLVALHGHGDEPASARAWGRRLLPAGWELVAPGAPRDAEGVRSWFPTGPRGVEPTALDDAAGRIAALVEQLRADGRRVVVAGFSQGAALALVLGRGGVQPDAVVAVCGFLPELDRAGPAAELRPPVRSGPRHPPTLLVAAAEDEVVPAFLSEDAAAVLAADGAPVTGAVLPGGHEVGPFAADRARAWLAEVLAPRLQVSVALPVDRVDAGAELVSGDAVADLSIAYERLGFHATFVTDHPAPDERWLAAGGHHALEPTVALAVAGAATRHLLLHTNLYVLPYRNTFLAAKALASLDVMSGGRLVLGVGAGYLRPEFRALGADADGRGAALEEALELLPRIWAGPVDVPGTGGADGPPRRVHARPSPWQRPHPPIWVGGNSAAALRRAVRHGQGWSPLPTPGGLEKAVGTSAIRDLDELGAALVRAAARCEAEGRTEPLTVCFTPFAQTAYSADPDRGLAAVLEEAAALTEMGIDWLAITVPGRSRAEVRDRAAALAAGLRLG